MQTTSNLTDWTSTPRAVELLASIAANPPRTVRQLAPLSQCWDVSAPDYVLVYDRNDDRVDEPGHMSDAAFRAVEAERGTAAAMLLTRLDDAIAVAVAGARVAA